jgi:excisionase family DNA binding protein
MKVHSGVLLSPATCAVIGPGLLDLLTARRVAGLPTPENVRREVQEVFELGRKFQAATLAKRQTDVRQDVRFVDCGRSSVVPSFAVTYSSAQAAKKLGIGQRAVQRRAERGSLRALRTPGGELRFERAEIDREARRRA